MCPDRDGTARADRATADYSVEFLVSGANAVFLTEI